MNLKIGHLVDVKNWRDRLEAFRPECLELYLLPTDITAEGFENLERQLAALANHPLASRLSFLAVSFPWGSRQLDMAFTPIDYNYYIPFIRLLEVLEEFCQRLGLQERACVLNFHVLYQVPSSALSGFVSRGKGSVLQKIYKEAALSVVWATVRLRDELAPSVSLSMENGAPLGEGGYLALLDVSGEDLRERSSVLPIEVCCDLSHFFMSYFYYRDEGRTETLQNLEMYRDSETGSPPKSLTSLEAFCELVQPLYFHVSDVAAPGYLKSSEGAPVGKGLVDWEETVRTLRQYSAKVQNTSESVPLILEIVGGHTLEGKRRCQASEKRLREAFALSADG